MLLGRLILPLLATAALVIGCSSNGDTGSADSGADGSDLVGCDDSRTQIYAANMQVTGQSGVFTFVLVSSQPAPPADETNTWVLQILDANGSAVKGATGTAVATMPLMSHGTTPVTWTAEPDGTYTLTPLYLFMAGLWEVKVTTQSGSQSDSTSFYFCVAG